VIHAGALICVRFGGSAEEMFMNEIDEIAHVIQLSIAPVFLLTGVGTLLNVLSGRLARIIDRARVLEQRLETPESPRSAAPYTSCTFW
jgi:hypothetical protein